MAIEGLGAIRSTNMSGVPTELTSLRTIALLQAFAEFAVGCLLVWQTDWCVGILSINDRPNAEES
jgi:hypothetical protein